MSHLLCESTLFFEDKSAYSSNFLGIRVQFLNVSIFTKPSIDDKIVVRWSLLFATKVSQMHGVFLLQKSAKVGGTRRDVVVVYHQRQNLFATYQHYHLFGTSNCRI